MPLPPTTGLSCSGRFRAPLDFALLGGVDLLRFTIAEQDLLYLAVQVGASLRIPGIETKVVDEQRLMDQPFLPAVLADVTHDPLPEVILEGRPR